MDEDEGRVDEGADEGDENKQEDFEEITGFIEFRFFAVSVIYDHLIILFDFS